MESIDGETEVNSEDERCGGARWSGIFTKHGLKDLLNDVLVHPSFYVMHEEGLIACNAEERHEH